jgi:hypothetical protein
LRVLYELISAVGLNPALAAPTCRTPGWWNWWKAQIRCSRAGRSTSVAEPDVTRCAWRAHGWDAVGIDMLGRAIDKARSRARGAAASARFIQGDVTRLGELVSATAGLRSGRLEIRRFELSRIS